MKKDSTGIKKCIYHMFGIPINRIRVRYQDGWINIRILDERVNKEDEFDIKQLWADIINTISDAFEHYTYLPDESIFDREQSCISVEFVEEF